ncbi:unnamed protein product [Ceratitis capitata]|uniref:(Mediterranean fruit fly) hypothetical protein n=1 Tax=Ceratitis capitata TaxID=7213 RepID=A0A811U3A9_CERCA|nr:unnamed protein product [Ceratitis capitata]
MASQGNARQPSTTQSAFTEHQQDLSSKTYSSPNNTWPQQRPSLRWFATISSYNIMRHALCCTIFEV